MMISSIIIMILALIVIDKPRLVAINGPLFVFNFAFLGFGGQAKFLGHARDITAYVSQ